MDRQEKALELFAARCNCAQSVLSASIDETTLGRRQALGVAAAFGAGMARTGRVCGAVTGGLMALGLKYGPKMAEDPKAGYEQLCQRAQRFMASFEERHGSVDCRTLTGCDMRTPEGQAKYKAEAHEKLCCGLVADAVRLLDEA